MSVRFSLLVQGKAKQGSRRREWQAMISQKIYLVTK
jgi:hypothetical protein